VSVPTVDLGPWRAGDRDTTAAALDAALTQWGFFLLTGHGLPPLADAVRAEARAFFALPETVKQTYATTVGGRGWLPPGVEANGYSEGTATPPDLKETFALGASPAAGHDDPYWYRANVWPSQTPALETLLTAYAQVQRALADELLGVCGHALGDDAMFAATAPTWTLNVNHYPSLTATGAPAPGQFRIGPHTDFGTLTLLDREPGAGGLQVDAGDDTWQDAPYDPAAITVNAGDLLAFWSGGRWRSARHRVLPPSRQAPAEDLVSLVLFCETDPDRLVTPLGGGKPLLAGEFVRARLDAISL
jgi:isopenicillin N synthase-like dioxygenase